MQPTFQTPLRQRAAVVLERRPVPGGQRHLPCVHRREASYSGGCSPFTESCDGFIRSSGSRSPRSVQDSMKTPKEREQEGPPELGPPEPPQGGSGSISRAKSTFGLLGWCPCLSLHCCEKTLGRSDLEEEGAFPLTGHSPG